MNDDNIKAGLLHLEDAICEHERGGAPGYTLILIPHNRGEQVHISRDGKPAEIGIGLAIDLAFIERGTGGT